MEEQLKEEWRKKRLEELKQLPIDEQYEEIAGFSIPFGFDCIIKEVKQGEQKTKSGIYTGVGSASTVGCSIGIIMSIGELVSRPIFEGMRVYYKPNTILRVNVLGEEYIQLNQADIYGAVTPETHFQLHYAGFIEKRREKRVDGMKAVMKHDSEEFHKKVDIQENKGKTNFPLTK